MENTGLVTDWWQLRRQLEETGTETLSSNSKL